MEFVFMEEKLEEEKFQVQLSFEPQTITESVAVVGDFTGWEDRIYLEKTEDGNIWKTDMELPSGEYAYHFLIDGNSFRLESMQSPPDRQGGNFLFETCCRRYRQGCVRRRAYR